MTAPLIVLSGSTGVGKTTISRLVAETFDPSVHVRADDFWPFIVNGWIDPNLPQAEHQNDILGGAAVSAAMLFAEGDYTVLFDCSVLPSSLARIGSACRTRSIPLHYIVLRTDLATCRRRVVERGHDVDDGPFERFHERFAELGEHESHVIDTTGALPDVVDAVLLAISAGSMRVG